MHCQTKGDGAPGPLHPSCQALHSQGKVGCGKEPWLIQGVLEGVGQLLPLHMSQEAWGLPCPLSAQGRVATAASCGWASVGLFPEGGAYTTLGAGGGSGGRGEIGWAMVNLGVATATPPPHP